MTKALAILLLLFPLLALAGGNSWVFEGVVVGDLEDGKRHKIELIHPIVTKKEDFPYPCDKLTIFVEYKWPWYVTKKPMTKADHYQAIGYLKHAYTVKDNLVFGVMGEGLAIKPDSKCEAISNGLRIHGAHVYSYYKWP